MAITLSANASCSLSATHQNPLALSTNYIGNPQLSHTLALATSALSNIYFGSRTATAATDTINLIGSLVDAYGNTLTFATVKALLIVNTHATASLTLFGGSNALQDGTFVLTAGKAFFTDSVFTVDVMHKNIVIDPGSATITFSVYILGS